MSYKWRDVRRALLPMIVIVALSLTSAVLPALSLQPLTASHSQTSPLNNQQVSSSKLQGVRGNAILIGIVDTRELTTTFSQSASKVLPFLSPKDSSAASRGTLSPQVLATTSSSSVGLSSEFDGLNMTQSGGFTPPDVQVAAGPNNVVEMVNVEGETFSKTGVSLNTFSLPGFFQVPSNHLASDPKILFDTSSGRWFASIIDFNFSGVVPQFSRVVIAVSTTSNPTTWNLYSVTGTFGLGPHPVGGVTDQPIIGVSDDKFVVSVNDFANDNSGNQDPQGAQFWVLSKSEMTSGASNVDFATFGPNPSLFSVHPVQSLSSTTTEYMVTVGANVTGACLGCVPQLIAVTGLPPGNVTVTSSPLSILPVLVVPAAVEPNGFVTTDDTRVSDAAWFQGKLWFALNDGCYPSGDGVLRSCVHLVQVDTTQNPPRALQNFEYGASGQYFYYPALRIDGGGNLIVVYGFSSSSTYPSIAVTGQLTTDPVNSLAASALLKSGSASDQTTRYGDYFGAGVDPSDTALVWIAGEYNRAAAGSPGCPNSCWSTFIGSASMTGFSVFPNPSSLSIQPGSSATSTVRVTSLNGFSGKVTLATSVSQTGLTTTQNSTKVTIGSGSSAHVSLTVSTISTTQPGNYVISVTGTSGSFTRTALLSVPIPDFKLVASPSTISEPVGGSTSTTIVGSTPNGFSGVVNLSVSVSPSSGATCSISPASITPNTNGASTLTCGSSSSGIYNITVTGTSGSIVHKIYVSMSAAPFSVAANPVTMILNPNVAGTSSITVSSISGFTGTITLSSVASSTSVTASFSSTSILVKSGGSNSSVLTVTPSFQSVGNYTVTVTATSGTMFNSITISIIVKSFSLSANPPTVAAPVGTTATYIVTVSALNGFTGTVSLSWSAGAGVTCSLNPTSVTLGKSVNSTLSCSGSPGLFRITVIGTSGSVNQYLTVILGITDFSLSTSATYAIVFRDSPGSLTASLSPLDGFTGNIAMSASGLPPGTTVSFNPNPVQISSYFTVYSTITISPTSSTPLGNHTITITGTIGSLSHSVTLIINVWGASTFTIPNTSQIFTGANDTYSGSLAVNLNTMSLVGSMSYTAVNSTTGVLIDAATVSMNLPITPGGTSFTTSAVEIPTTPYWTSVTCIFYVSQGTLSCGITRTLDLDHNGTIDVSDYNAVVASYGCSVGQSCYNPLADLLATGLVDITDVSLEQAHNGGPLFLPADFALNAAPNPVNLLSGKSANSQISATALNGFAGSVNATVSSPAGITCSLNPSNIKPGSTTSTLACSSSTIGTYAVTINGVGDSITHTETVTVNATPFGLASNPASTNIHVQSSGTLTITVSAGSGFSGNVSLTATISTTGPTASFNPATVTVQSGGNGTSTLTISTGSTPTGTYTITVTGTSGSASVQVTIPLAVSDFTVTGLGALTVAAGNPYTGPVTVTGINGFVGTVTLSFSLSPNTLTCTMNPASVTLGSSASAALLCSNVTGSKFTITVTGTSGSLSHSATGTLFVSDFTFTGSPLSLTVQRMSFSSSTLSITTNANYVSFNQIVLTQTSPSGFSTIFADPAAGNFFGNGLTNFVFANSTDTLTFVVLADSSITPGTYALTVSASSAGTVHTVSISVIVPTFTVSANPSSLSFKASSSGSSTIAVTGVNGYTGTIQLSLSISAQGLSCTISPGSITLGSSGTSTLTCNGLVGTYTVTVTAANNSFSRSVTLPVTVTR